MASRALNDRNIQIAISQTNEFLQDIPSCFTVGNDSMLHHQPDEATVISHKEDFFADANPEVLKVEDIESFALLKHRLLTLPIYLHVHLERHRRSGNTRIMTHCDYVVMVNTKFPAIQEQLLSKLNEMEVMFREEKNFSVEFSFEEALEDWFASIFNDSRGTYYARNSTFCVTNFRQRCKYCTEPGWWILCLPCCILGVTIHCVYRAIVSEDSALMIQSDVAYIKGTTPAQRAEIRQLVRAAYVQGLMRSTENRERDRQMYEQSYI